MNQKEEALTFKDKQFKQTNQDLKKLRAQVLSLKEELNLKEEKSISMKAQLRTQNDTIRRLERQLQNFQNTKSIAIQLENPDSNSLPRAIDHSNQLSPLSRNGFESKTF